MLVKELSLLQKNNKHAYNFVLFISQWSQFTLQHVGNTMVGNNWLKNVHFVTLFQILQNR